MKPTGKTNTFATGLAMFSMFFGAGNVVFPLALGQVAQSQNFFVILGLLITAVGVPFLGLMSMTLFDGNYKHFFERVGKTPGFLVTLLLMLLVGPFGAIPRCIALSFSTIKHYVPFLSLPLFSFLSCVLIYLLSFRKSSLLDILGYFLTPILLGSLFLIVILGFFDATEAPISSHSPSWVFLTGLKEGYKTMDLIGAFFFSSVVLICLKKDLPSSEEHNHKKLIFLTLKAGIIGMGLLCLTYIGFSYVSSYNSALLESVPKDELLGVLANHLMGSYGGIVTSIAVALACLTTAIALSVVFAEFLNTTLCKEKVGYQTSLLITLAISCLISTMNFMGIDAFLSPILNICYPALIILSLLNMAHKLRHWQQAKLPFFLTIIATIVGYWVIEL